MRVIREINRGGFGCVEEVELPDGTRAARKTFSPSIPISSDEERRKLLQRFEREARIQSSLNLGGIVPTSCEGLSAPEPYYLMPLADKNLQDEIQVAKISNVPLDKALADVLNALDELHELGYVHRDLKPANVLLVDGLWRLSDFGLALPPSGATTKLTSTGSNWGTAAYCAPEQALEFRNATPLVDIYAFGCILHDVYGAGPRVPYQRYSAPGDMGAIIEKCTEVKASKRFQSVRALRGALATLLATPPNSSLSAAGSDWVLAVKDINTWSNDTLERFLRFLSNSADRGERIALYSQIDEDALEVLERLDNDLFKSLSNMYCEWVEDAGFPWDFCDVIVRRLEKIFEKGDIETRASVALAAAELARSHNRWFVMGRVLSMCGSTLDDSAARRIAIEIKARQAEDKFRACASRINRSISDFHPKIAAALCGS